MVASGPRRRTLLSCTQRSPRLLPFFLVACLSFGALFVRSQGVSNPNERASDANFSSTQTHAQEIRNASSREPEKGSVCVNQGPRFPPFSSAGKPPRKSMKGDPDELTFCRVYKAKTCCGRAQTTAAWISVRKLSSSGEASEECLAHWEALECSICHPLIGISPSPPPAICKSFCEKLFASCSDAFFSTDPNLKILSPCSPISTICSKAVEFTSNGSDFCTLAGFRVVDDETFQPDAYAVESSTSSNQLPFFCFDGNPTSIGLEMVSVSDLNRKEAKTEKSRQKKSSPLFKLWFQSFVEHSLFGENVVWVIAGLVLTGGAYLRWRGLKGRRRRAAMFAAARNKQQKTVQQAAKRLQQKQS